MAAAQRAREQGAVAQQVGADVDAVGPGATDLDVAPAHGRVAQAVAAICHCASSRCPRFAAVSAAPIAAVSKRKSAMSSYRGSPTSASRRSTSSGSSPASRSEEHTSELPQLMPTTYLA